MWVVIFSGDFANIILWVILVLWGFSGRGLQKFFGHLEVILQHRDVEMVVPFIY